MSLHDEQVRALNEAELLLISLIHPSYDYHWRVWKRLHPELRKAAKGVLRHFPSQTEIQMHWKK